MSPQLPMPVKIVQNMPNGQATTILKSAQLNASVPDSMFQLPKGTKVREMQMPGGMPTGRPAPPR